ncbi:DNA-3-methyladenine glycosylase [Mariniphaga anaerophila]|uniref:Putative 3-methyladenine DNA glycosylase n=1 Tax=Mariniphaga anaerophila TaxID=1484053 RepID=A0A1M5BR94_9BACT|nr:DNA-3-methyladenine glycosylase [Mariniphaga anaerophila]SHF44936.1 DNA-3-methyladenine glycosylase [Mariniphaga anaerophila]
MSRRLPASFFRRSVLDVAPDLLGKVLVRKFDDENLTRYVITEVEAYNGQGDLACHASKGKTPRTEVMFREGGLVYVYLVYGIHWMLNIVAGRKEDASAVLIRGLENIEGPGRVGKELLLDKSFYGENLSVSKRIWIEDSEVELEYATSPRVGINYAGEPWVSKPWRFVATSLKQTGRKSTEKQQP